MDITMEKRIAKAFVVKNKQERFLFELSNKRRLDAICKLPAIIQSSVILSQSNRLPEPYARIKEMKSYGVKDRCYVLSEYYQEGLDGEYLSLLQAVEKLQCNGFPSLIVGLPSGFSHLTGEGYLSYQPNFFLKPIKRFDCIPW